MPAALPSSCPADDVSAQVAAPPAAAPAPVPHAWLLGTAEGARRGILHLAWMLPAHLFVAAVLAAAVPLGFVPVWQAQAIVGYGAAGLLAFYAVLRSGLVPAEADPLLVQPLLLFNLSVLALTCARVEPARGLALPWLCALLLFDVQRLTLRQVHTALGLAGAGLVAAWLAQVLSASGAGGGAAAMAGSAAAAAPGLRIELLNLVLWAISLPALHAVARVAAQMRERSDEQRAELAHAREQIQALSLRDGLTGLFNRRHLRGLLEAEVRRQQRTGRPFSVAVIDLDHFRALNDRHGHAVGDAVLRRFAQVLACCGEGSADVAGRWGGEEFLVVMPETSDSQALERLARLRAEVAAQDWSALAPGLTLSFSAGVSSHDAEDLLHRTLERADAALYRAKNAGRDLALAADEVD